MMRSAFPPIQWWPRAVARLLFLRLATFAMAVLSLAVFLRASQGTVQAAVVIDFDDGTAASRVGALYAGGKAGTQCSRLRPDNWFTEQRETHGAGSIFWR